jgi:hypothetical protein
MMRKWVMTLFVLMHLYATLSAQVSIEQKAYQATIGEDGFISSLFIGGCNVLGKPIQFCVGVNWKVERIEKRGDGREVFISLTSERGKGELLYRFGDDSIAITMLHHLGGFQTWQVFFSDEVLAVEDLQCREVDGAEAIQYSEHGQIRPTPLVPLVRIQRMRLYLRNGSSVLFWHDGWGAPFNLDEIGSLRGFTYQRNLHESDKPMTLYFVVERVGNLSLQPAPAFVPYGEAFANMFYLGEPITFNLRFTEATMKRLKACEKWLVRYEVTDFWKHTVTKGTMTFRDDEALKGGSIKVSFLVNQTGWFAVLFSLQPATKISPPMLPSQFLTRFAVVNRHPLFPERPSPNESVSDYGYSALLGLKCIRESIDISRIFPERGKVDWKWLDEFIERANAESKRWGVSWIFQANNRPRWCDESDYEQIAFELVSRYKDKVKFWEVENEPNFSYSPQDYIRLALLPFLRGAKRADPSAQVIAPACVSLPHTFRFIEAIISADALKLLDGVSTHTYVGPNEPWELFGHPQYLARLKKMVDDKPLWQTEQGYNWGNDPKQRHARYVVRQFLLANAFGITNERHYYFYPVHHGFEPWYLVESGSSEGLNGTLEPAAVALRIMNEQIVGREVVELRELLFGVYALRFRGRQDDLVALWTLDFPITLTLQGRVLEGVDFMGNKIALKPSAKNQKVVVSGYPVYLRLPLGGEFKVVSPRLGENVALASTGAKIRASSYVEGHPPEHAIDGIWSGSAYDPPVAHDLPTRTFWEDATEGTSPDNPDWLEISFPQPRTITAVAILTPLPNIDATPRDFFIEVQTPQGWQKVASVKGSAEWAHLFVFAAIKVRAIKIVITRINDGWHLDGKWMFMVGEKFTRYTNLRTKVIEVMAFAPASQRM